MQTKIDLQDLAYHLYEILLLRNVVRVGYGILDIQKPIYVDAHALRTAQLSRMFAKMEGLSKEEQTQAFIIGLVHDNPDTRTNDAHLVSRHYNTYGESNALSDQVKPLGGLSKTVANHWQIKEKVVGQLGLIAKGADWFDTCIEIKTFKERKISNLPYKAFFGYYEDQFKSHPDLSKLNPNLSDLCRDLKKMSLKKWAKTYLGHKLRMDKCLHWKLYTVYCLAFCEGFKNPEAECEKAFDSLLIGNENEFLQDADKLIKLVSPNFKNKKKSLNLETSKQLAHFMSKKNFHISAVKFFQNVI